MKQEEIDRAIERIENDAYWVGVIIKSRSASHLPIAEYQESYKHYKTAIEALRQYKPSEGCEWCLPSEQEAYKGVMPLDFVSFQEFDGWHETISKMPKNYCPNCGRQLKGD